jgi:glucose/mannose-6-phosphate isomerase
VIDLDDPAALSAADPAGMLETAGQLPAQCRTGYEIGRAVRFDVPATVRAVVFCGMGGSGVAGDVVRTTYAERLGVPVLSVRGPELPAFCDDATLVVASSYSGGTAETLEAFDAAARRGCRLVAIAAGGALTERATRAGAPVVRVPGGLMPRAAFGFLVLSAVGVVESAGLLPALGAEVAAATGELDAVVETLVGSVPVAVNEAKRVAVAIGSRFPVVWGEDGIASAAAARWKTQMNENAKVPATSSALPELDHNEVVGWAERTGERFAVVALRHEGERDDDAARFAPSLEIASDAGARTEEVWARGSSALSRLLSLVAIGDHASIYLAMVRGVDPTPIDAIVRLKQALADA